MFDVKAAEMTERVAMATFAAPPTPTAKYPREYPALFRLSFIFTQKVENITQFALNYVSLQVISMVEQTHYAVGAFF